MRALSVLAITPTKMAALSLLAALASTFACASSSCHRNDYRGVACRAGKAREALVFGLPRDAALDAMGQSEVEPPWKNELGLGPATIHNPFDSESFTSPLGEQYEVVRFFVEATGNPRCPFVKGELKFEPLIFVNDKLVGWKWSYLADVLGRRLTPKETGWEFGAFCNSQRSSPSDLTDRGVDGARRSSDMGLERDRLAPSAPRANGTAIQQQSPPEQRERG